MTKVRIYNREYHHVMSLDCKTERTVDGARLTCDLPPGFNILDPIPRDLVAFEDGKGRFVGKVYALQINRQEDDLLIIDTIDPSEQMRRCIAWPEPEL